MSLSSNFSDSSDLLCIKRPAKQRAPSIPSEFFLIDPSRIPKSNDLIWVFFIRSSKIIDNPT